MMIMTFDQFVKKKKKKKKKIFRPTCPNFFGHVTGNTHTFLFGLTVPRQKVFVTPKIDVKCRFDFMTQKFGHESKKIYLKVYCNLIDIKMFTFTQILKKCMVSMVI